MSLYVGFQNLVWTNFTLLKTNTNCMHNISSEIEATDQSTLSALPVDYSPIDSIRLK